MTTLVANDCAGCVARARQNRQPICDGSGVLAYSEWPAEKSYVVVCPEFDCDSDPDAIWEAAEWANPAPEPTPELMAAVKEAVLEQRKPSLDDLMVDEYVESTDVARGILTAGLLAFLFFVVIGAGYVGWRYL